ncbi:MAG: DNA topoisomerase VI subunit B [Candidatus Thorarchaeota archaeon]
MLSFDTTSPDIVELSISSWFYRNRTIAGFDNPARSLYVSIRELIENSLDAAETAGTLPQIFVSLEETEGNLDSSSSISGEPKIFKLTVRDNGTGIARKNVPKLIGKMLSGTKFMYCQSRGTFGLGGSLALLYGQITTQKPIRIITGQLGDSQYHSLKMKLDIEKNKPIVLDETTITKLPSQHGTTVTYFLQGDWFRSKRRIIDYFTQTSIIVPYATLRFETPDGEVYEYKRVIDDLPIPPKEMKPHPSGIDVEMLKSMISTTRATTLKSFLMRSFQRIGPSTAISFMDYAGLDQSTDPTELSDAQLVLMMRSLSTFNNFMAPSPKSLSPAGESVLAAGMKRLNPEIVVVRQRSPNVYEGHPFVIETGVAYGGNIASGAQLYRFANRIPLLYDERTDVSSIVIRELNIKSYGLRKDDPIAFFVHICSTRIPYKTVGKEFIADVDVIRREIELGFKDCLRKISELVRKKNRTQRMAKRENKLQQYYKFIADTLSEATERKIRTDQLFPGER